MRRGFLSLLGILLAIAIILFLGYKLLEGYFQQSVSVSQRGRSLSGSGIDASPPSSVVGSTRIKIKDIEKKRRKDVEEQMRGL